MPEMNGIELLKRVRERCPETTRIILSGYVDADVIQTAINEGQVYKFLSKPWDDADLRMVLRDAVARVDAVQATRSAIDVASTLEREAREMGLDLGDVGSGDEDGLPEREPASSLRHALDNPLSDAPVDMLRRVIDALPVAVVGIDPGGTVVLANRYAGALFHTECETMLGRSFDEGLAADIVHQLRQGALTIGGGFAGESRFSTEGVQYVCVPMQSAQGACEIGRA